MAHSYFYAGEQEAGIAAAHAFGETELGLSREGNPDVVTFRYGLFSVDDARRVIRLSDQAPLTGDQKLIIVAVERLFHEAQNALLKLFEEPTPGTTLILVVPTIGIVLPTLRSRMTSLPRTDQHKYSDEVRDFIRATEAEREKIVSKLLDRAKSDKDEEKQRARGELLRLMEGLMCAGYAQLQKKEDREVRAFLSDLDRFIPILHERSAPNKLISEHVLLTMPNSIKVV